MSTSLALSSEAGWRPLYRAAGIAAIIVAALIPIQAVVFLAFPPPKTVVDYFALFQKQPLLGLLDLDLLLSLDNLLLVIVYLALFACLRPTSRSLAVIGLAFGMIGTTLYLISREATFSMLALSNQYAAATADVEKASFIAAGQTLLTIYNGSAFDISYVLGGVAVLVFSLALLRSRALGLSVGVIGIIMAVLMFVPPTIGPIGLFISMISLIPTVVWLILIAVRLFRLPKNDRAGRISR